MPVNQGNVPHCLDKGYRDPHSLRSMVWSPAFPKLDLDPAIDSDRVMALATATASVSIRFIRASEVVGADRVELKQRAGIQQVGADGDSRAELVRELRLSGSKIPVIVVGSGMAFRTATAIARLEFTDFLERPLTAPKLRAAVARACGTGT